MVVNRLFVDAVVWMARSFAPWRGLPPEFEKWASTHTRFRRWTLKEPAEKVVKASRTISGI